LEADKLREPKRKKPWDKTAKKSKKPKSKKKKSKFAKAEANARGKAGVKDGGSVQPGSNPLKRRKPKNSE